MEGEAARLETRERGPGGSRGSGGGGERHPPWRWPNLLCLDAPVIAVLWQALFASAAGVIMPAAAHGVLAAAVWVICVVGRLLDAVRPDGRAPATARHRFCRRHGRAFFGGVVFAGMLGAAATAWMLSEGLAARGLFMALLVGGYFAWVEVMRRFRKVVIPKEILCGILFAIGTNLAPAFYLSNQDAGGFSSAGTFLLEGLLGVAEATTLPNLVFMALCCLNCALIAVWDEDADTAQDPAALPQRAGRRLDVPFRWSFPLLAGVSLAMMAREWGGDGAVVYACVAASALGLALLERAETRFSKHARRALADVALLTPLVALLAGW